MNDSEESSVPLFWWIQEIISHIEIHSPLHKKWMILIIAIVAFNYSDEFKKLSYTSRFMVHYIRNEQFWVQFCSTILINSRNYPHIEIHSTLHTKWMILRTVLFNYSNEFKKLSYIFRFIAHYIRNEWSSTEFCPTILINSRNYRTHWSS